MAEGRKEREGRGEEGKGVKEGETEGRRKGRKVCVHGEKGREEGRETCHIFLS